VGFAIAERASAVDHQHGKTHLRPALRGEVPMRTPG
jgi:hypothetical protein